MDPSDGLGAPLRARTSLTRVDPVYMTELPDAVILSDRAMWAAAVTETGSLRQADVIAALDHAHQRWATRITFMEISRACLSNPKAQSRTFLTRAAGPAGKKARRRFCRRCSHPLHYDVY